MGLETTTDAHGVLLLNSNAMGERNTHKCKETLMFVRAHMPMNALTQNVNAMNLHHMCTQSHSIAYSVSIYDLSEVSSVFNRFFDAYITLCNECSLLVHLFCMCA